MYNENHKKATQKYIKNSQKRIDLKILKTDYEQIIEPAIKASGMPTTTYIKKAIFEKIERDNDINGKNK